jgi:uncharacterized membrane protein
MSASTSFQKSGIAAKFAMIAVMVTLVGITDAAYLTYHHLKKELVPCSIVSGCETVLTSVYAEFYGIPLAAFGLAAYLVAFILAIFAFFGNRQSWFLFGLQVCVMAIFTVWLLYLQAFVINAFCQFCLLSAGVTLTLFIIALISKFWRFR